jgi:3' terminal RNA ribose 2'-O-methyltransferase Hen1
MLLTLSTTHSPATDLGFLLHKNPANEQTRSLSFGRAHVFYPQANADICTAALLLDVDVIGLVRGRKGERTLEHYVNDRPYVASSFVSVALARLFREALNGQSKERPELAQTPIPLVVELPVVPARGGEEFVRDLFQPLGYQVQTKVLPLDESFPTWGDSRYVSLRLEATARVADVLSHLYVLLPVLDDDKHYWIGDDEVEKLLSRGEGWLVSHPQREAIVARYLGRRKHLTRAAWEQLTANDDEREEQHDREEEVIEKPISLHKQRLDAVMAELKASGAKRVLDLGCGEGRLLGLLLKEKQFAEIVGLDVSHRSLETALERLRFERLAPMQQARLKLWHGSLTYRDARLEGFDAAAVVEVIEHLDAARLAAFERVLWEFARPATVVLTTPNAEYNVMWPTLPAGKMRHKDHRFEWTRAEFQEWANKVAARFGYEVRFAPLGPEDETVGAPSQMAVFTRL